MTRQDTFNEYMVKHGLRIFSDTPSRQVWGEYQDDMGERERELTEFARAWILRDQLDRKVGQAPSRKGGWL
jgi:hypothetical protein